MRVSIRSLVNTAAGSVERSTSPPTARMATASFQSDAAIVPNGRLLVASVNAKAFSDPICWPSEALASFDCGRAAMMARTASSVCPAMM